MCSSVPDRVVGGTLVLTSALPRTSAPWLQCIAPTEVLGLSKLKRQRSGDGREVARGIVYIEVSKSCCTLVATIHACIVLQRC